jgi:hypothetical protein
VQQINPSDTKPRPFTLNTFEIESLISDITQILHQIEKSIKIVDPIDVYEVYTACSGKLVAGKRGIPDKLWETLVTRHTELKGVMFAKRRDILFVFGCDVIIENRVV